jgi:hypothetical protein
MFNVCLWHFFWTLKTTTFLAFSVNLFPFSCKVHLQSRAKRTVHSFCARKTICSSVESCVYYFSLDFKRFLLFMLGIFRLWYNNGSKNAPWNFVLLKICRTNVNVQTVLFFSPYHSWRKICLVFCRGYIRFSVHICLRSIYDWCCNSFGFLFMLLLVSCTGIQAKICLWFLAFENFGAT